MKITSIIRLKRLCKFIYIVSIFFVLIYFALHVNLSNPSRVHKRNAATTTTTSTTTKSRSLVQILKAHLTTKELRKLRRFSHVTIPSPSTHYSRKQHRSGLFRSGQKFPQTFKSIQNHYGYNPSWHGGQRFCGNKLEIINDDIVFLRDVILDTKQKFSKRKGGETIQDVLNQRESDEDVEIRNGLFRLSCSVLPLPHTFRFSSLFHQLFSGIQSAQTDQALKADETFSDFTIIRRRVDYANLYWTLIELYDTYLTVKLLGKDPKSTRVIIFDAHPMGKLDDMWNLIFGKVIRIGRMVGEVFIKELVWSIHGASSPINQWCESLPFIESYKNSFYTAVGFNSKIDICSNLGEKPIITLILRKDYVAHPRNPTGRLMRKLLNERELIEHLTRKFHNYIFYAVQLDTLSVEAQIRLISQTSVLLGVHGAGMAYTLLLRPGATSIEFFPSNYRFSPNPHFEQFAVWGDVNYYSWYAPHSDRGLEWVTVPVDEAERMVQKALNNHCK